MAPPVALGPPRHLTAIAAAGETLGGTTGRGKHAPAIERGGDRARRQGRHARRDRVVGRYLPSGRRRRCSDNPRAHPLWPPGRLVGGGTRVRGPGIPVHTPSVPRHGRLERLSQLLHGSIRWPRHCRLGRSTAVVQREPRHLRGQLHGIHPMGAGIDATAIPQGHGGGPGRVGPRASPGTREGRSPSRSSSPGISAPRSSTSQPTPTRSPTSRPRLLRSGWPS